jgi:hypothetical protein
MGTKVSGSIGFIKRQQIASASAACPECGRDHAADGIGGFYDRVDCQKKAARRLWEAAKPEDKARLWEKMIDAGNCGD